MMENRDQTEIGVALAALSVCESLIVSLVEKGILSAQEFEEIVESARDAHENARPQIYSSRDHREAARILRLLLTGSNGVRGTARL